MPRYLIERTFPDGLDIPQNDVGDKIVGTVIDNNTVEDVFWLHSYVSEDRTKTFCVYDGPTPEAIRTVATRNGLPLDTIAEVSVLTPYPYRGAGS